MNTDYNVGIYCRLSREDLKGGTGDHSLSIENQQSIITSYVNEKGWSIYKVYIDDDETGTTFNRPAFQEMMKDIENAKINCVITKDLSRLGRNYVDAGRYRQLFADYNVRYIAIHDNHDSFIDDNNISTPIKEIMNEYYAADISRKVRHSKKNMAQQGKFSNSRAPYGYLKSPTNKHVLIIDEDVSQNVSRIFEMFLSGKTARSIAETFNNENIPTSNNYYYSKLNKPNPFTSDKNKWGSQTIISIIKNPVYYGAISNGKREVKSFKNKTILHKDISDWIIVEDMHEPIVTKEIWLEAQEVCMKNNKGTVRRNSKGEVTIFAGIIKCGCCGGNLVYNEKRLKSGVKPFFRCSTYTQKGKSACRVNYVSYDVVYKAVLENIQEYAVLATEDEQVLINKVIESNNNFKDNDIKRYKKEIVESTNRISAIDKLLQNLYEDKVSGTITTSLFNQMANKYSAEQNELITRVDFLKKDLDKHSKSEDNLTVWTNKIKECLKITELTRPLVFELIDKIEVFETLDENNKKDLKISIYYKFDYSNLTANVGA